MTAKALEREGFNVLTAVNGSLALQLLTAQKGNIDIVLMDLQMPGE